ncbi:hypothetical protein C4B60_07585 [Jeotgalibacillus proteolyticus]|uniref:Uncharacterized protein n=1 Tax=Jeotgalibacillus proteolyticus TaxID=2082395 RepID=A0A2S5GC94_9BACL|nr:hypothetical protein C4B60_07585 [Jeotgalibacillus proteolyticus]
MAKGISSLLIVSLIDSLRKLNFFYLSYVLAHVMFFTTKKLRQMYVSASYVRLTPLQADAFRGAGLELTCFQQVDLKLPLLPAGVAAFSSVLLTFLNISFCLILFMLNNF